MTKQPDRERSRRDEASLRVSSELSFIANRKSDPEWHRNDPIHQARSHPPQTTRRQRRDRVHRQPVRCGCLTERHPAAADQPAKINATVPLNPSDCAFSAYRIQIYTSGSGRALVALRTKIGCRAISVIQTPTYCCIAACRSGHSFSAPHFLGRNIGLRAKLPVTALIRRSVTSPADTYYAYYS